MISAIVTSQVRRNRTCFSVKSRRTGGVLSRHGKHPVSYTHLIAQQIRVSLLLILEAAHQTAARAGNFHRVEGKPLLLGHLDGDGPVSYTHLPPACTRTLITAASGRPISTPIPDGRCAAPIPRPPGAALPRILPGRVTARTAHRHDLKHDSKTERWNFP